jgi:hypothetical protein
MSAQEYWFARRLPAGRYRRGLAPVHRNGWYVIAAFLGCMLGGGLLFGFFMAMNRPLPGAVLYILCVVIGAGQFIYFSATRTDPARTLADYRAMKVAAPNDQLGGRR